MFPVICKIGPITIYSYGTMLALAVLVSTVLLSKDAEKKGIKREFVIDFVFWITVSGVLGARLFYILLNVTYFIKNPAEIFMLQNGGLAFQGGLITGTIVGIYYCRKRSVDLLTFADVAIPYMALGQAIGRIGCFLNGCCFGKKWLGGVFSPMHQEIYHPTQLYMFGSLMIIFLILKRYQSKSKFKGDTFTLYFILAPIARFVIEFFRADHSNTLLGLSVYQYVCLFLIVTSFYVRSRLNNRIAG